MAVAPASNPAPAYLLTASTEGFAPPLQAPDHTRAMVTWRSHSLAPAPSFLLRGWPADPAPQGATEEHTAQAQAASGAPTSSVKRLIPASGYRAASPEQRLDPRPLTVEFCRQLACAHNASAAPGVSIRDVQVPLPAPEPVDISAMKPMAKVVSLPPPVQAPMHAAAVPSQLLSVALSSGQLTDAVSAGKLGAQLTAVMPQSAPAPAASPQAAQQPGTEFQPPSYDSLPPGPQDTSASTSGTQKSLGGFSMKHGQHSCFSILSDGVCKIGMDRVIVHLPSYMQCAGASRGVVLTEVAGPGPSSLLVQESDMGQPAGILQGLELGYIDEPSSPNTAG